LTLSAQQECADELTVTQHHQVPRVLLELTFTCFALRATAFLLDY